LCAYLKDDAEAGAQQAALEHIARHSTPLARLLQTGSQCPCVRVAKAGRIRAQLVGQNNTKILSHLDSIAYR